MQHLPHLMRWPPVPLGHDGSAEGQGRVSGGVTALSESMGFSTWCVVFLTSLTAAQCVAGSSVSLEPGAAWLSIRLTWEIQPFPSRQRVSLPLA